MAVSTMTYLPDDIHALKHKMPSPEYAVGLLVRVKHCTAWLNAQGDKGKQTGATGIV